MSYSPKVRSQPPDVHSRRRYGRSVALVVADELTSQRQPAGPDGGLIEPRLVRPRDLPEVVPSRERGRVEAWRWACAEPNPKLPVAPGHGGNRVLVSGRVRPGSPWAQTTRTAPPGERSAAPREVAAQPHLESRAPRRDPR